jgi:hypothetical protein
MDSYSGAIVAAFQNSQACSSYFPGGIWAGQEAPEGTVLPYVELVMPAGSVLQTSGKDYIETSPATFTVWAAGMEVSRVGGTTLQGLYDVPGEVQLSPSKLLYFLNRGGQGPLASDRRDENGNVIYRLDLNYEAQIQRTKP